MTWLKEFNSITGSPQASKGLCGIAVSTIIEPK